MFTFLVSEIERQIIFSMTRFLSPFFVEQKKSVNGYKIVFDD